MINIRPTRNKLLVEPLIHSTESVRGIVIPEAHREQQLSIDCIVLAKGPDVTEDLNTGDRVLIERFKGTEVRQGRRVFILIPSNEVLAIIE